MHIPLTFLLKKIISLALMPISIGVILIMIAIWCVYKKKYLSAKISVISSVIYFLIISSTPFAHLMLSPLEKQYPRLKSIPVNVEYALLLGGDRQKRTWEGLRLLQLKDNLTLVTSGYSLHDKKLSNAEKTKRMLIESGVRKNQILMQMQAKDTEEEADYIEKLIGKRPFILITSAYHMPRSMKLFERKGLNPIAAPTDFNDPDEDGLFLSLFHAKNIRKVEHAWHEYIGFIYGYLSGKI